MARNPIPAKLDTDRLVALIDTREKIPLELAPLRTEPATLTTGDYSLAGMERIISVERKSLSDLLSCVGGDRKRFDREVMRLLAYPVRLLVVEATWGQVDEGHWTTRVSPAAVRGSILGWMAAGLPVMLAGSHVAAGGLVSEFLVLAARRRWHEARGLLGISRRKPAAAVSAETLDVPF